RIRTNKWQDKDGNERYTTEIVANDMKMLGSREGMGSPSSNEGEYGGSMPSTGGSGSGSARPAPAKKAPSFDDMDDDIPF
ncbi:MAG: single-stranded DNA-binding protein, partial [Candidatus Accumulibacter sp.]|nr:single-stranded DNA-binding protein [Candidatus Accumulibacter propinquus]